MKSRRTLLLLLARAAATAQAAPSPPPTPAHIADSGFAGILSGQRYSVTLR
jgi:hypothetical protein